MFSFDFVFFFHSPSSVIGALVIAIGFYAVMWAQSREKNMKGLEVNGLPSSSSAQESPLLESP
jgi:hypothetical protein